jgi:Flp pilus assembly protein TadG
LHVDQDWNPPGGFGPAEILVQEGRPRSQLGQSLVEFAISSVVLVLLFGGLVDLTRAIHFADVLQNAVREGSRQGAYFDAGSNSNRYLDDADIKAAVDAQLVAGGLPASTLKTAGACPAGTDNGQSNPPYPSSAFPGTGNQPWLYICYAGGTTDHSTTPATGLSGQDLNVVLVMGYSPLTATIPTPLGANLGLSTNLHSRIQGA